jgi:DNA-binding CsgD family transcriptional regulator
MTHAAVPVRLALRVAMLIAALMTRTDPGRRVLPGEARADLTQREHDVLGLIVEGKENAQIAKELFISVHTVRNHVSSILAKLEVENRVQAAVYAVLSRSSEPAHSSRAFPGVGTRGLRGMKNRSRAAEPPPSSPRTPGILW